MVGNWRNRDGVVILGRIGVSQVKGRAAGWME